MSLCLSPFPIFVSLFALAALAPPVSAQDTLRVTLPEVEVEAARQTEREATAPFALATAERGAATVALEPGLTLETTLRRLPGLWVNDRAHFGLGERLSIRGMGWRAAFGVRGVQVVLDGVPLTMPDGQTVIDVVDPSFIRRAELIRGPASLFWGNGSGGTLYLSTFAPDAPAFRARALSGSHGVRQLSAESGARVGAHRVYAYASDVRQDGFRAYSQGRFSRAAVFGDVDLKGGARLRVVATAVGQDTENPGSLTRDQFLANPRQANTRNVETLASKQTTHLQAGATLEAPTGLGVVAATAYGVRRDLDNALSYAYIRFDRGAGGVRLSLRNENGRLSWGTGVDAGLQVDDRWNWNNADGGPGSDLQIDQQENVRALAAFGHARLALTDRLHLSGGLRLDHLRFGLDDRLLGDDGGGDASGNRTFAAWSPAVALAYTLRGAVVFAGFSTAFESPTTTELVNRPDMTGGFNPDLAPQRVAGVEAGARGAWVAARLLYDVAVFRLYVTDRLTPYQTEAGGDRTFYRNSGENVHAGVEAAVEWLATPEVSVFLTYAGSRFTYRDAPVTGNRLPGVPDHRLVAGVEAGRDGLRVRLDAEAVGGYYVDDANTERNDGYVLFDASIGHAGLRLGTARVQPFAAVRNVFDTHYAASVIINATGGRFYEPAPGRTVQAGVGVAF